jgi:uncharacterized membrane protein YphA (DoxX/SURF4 family)
MVNSKLQLEKTYRAFVTIILSIWLQRFIRFALGAVFIYAGITKLISPKAFAKLISSYDLVPEDLLATVAIGLPVLEILAGIGLFFAVRGSLSIIFGLLVMFVFILWYGILKNLDIDCGCFSPKEIKNYASLQYAFYRDIVMIAAATYLYISNWVSGNKSISARTKINQI